MDESQSYDVLQDKLVEIAKQVNEALKPQWDARRDVARTLISLASAALIFTITFVSSLIKPDTHALLRYSIVVMLVGLYLLAYSLIAIPLVFYGLA